MDESVIAMKGTTKPVDDATAEVAPEAATVADGVAPDIAPDAPADEAVLAEPGAVVPDPDPDPAPVPVPAPAPVPVPDPVPVPQPDPVPDPLRQPDPVPDPVPEPVIEPVIELSGPPSRRLQQLGIELPPVAAPVAAYVPAVRTGNLIFTSGQLPTVDGVLSLTGVVGDQPVDISIEQAKALARTAALNAVAAVASMVDIDQVVRVVKVVGFVASAPGFTGQPQVINGASEVLGQIWGAAGGHARSAVGVIALPRNSPVEVEVVVEVGATPGDVPGDAPAETRE